MDLITEFFHKYRSQPTIKVSAPGRVNLLGEHVDYNNGPVLPAAINREATILAKSIDMPIVRLFAIDIQAEYEFRLDKVGDFLHQDNIMPQWAKYPAGVAWVLQELNYQISGIEAVYSSNIPMGSGLSSSAAIEVGFGLLWQFLSDLDLEPLQLAKICQKAENEYVGVACGLMDQFASVCGVKNHALYFDTKDFSWQALPLPTGTNIIIADSGVERNLASSAYNQRRLECELAVELIRQNLPNIQSLRDLSPVEFAAISHYLPLIIRNRAEHVIKEIARVESAVNALNRNDPQAFGALMFASHRSLRDLYEVSITELDQLVEIARSQNGCWGARMTGAGFGGCTVNLVNADNAQDFMRNLSDQYKLATGRKAKIYICAASQGAQAIPMVSLYPRFE